MEGGRPHLTRVAVAVDGEITTRAAQSLSAHPGVEVVLLAPADSIQFEVVESPLGCDAVVGSVRAVDNAAEAGLPVVAMGDTATCPGVSWASIQGLALALAADIEPVETVAVAMPGEPAGSETIVFPSPIDARSVRQEKVGSRNVEVGRGEGPLAAALALGRSRHRAVVDDHRFMEAIALAAGVALLAEDGMTRARPVWERPRPYLRAVTEMGLVIGERAPA